MKKIKYNWILTNEGDYENELNEMSRKGWNLVKQNWLQTYEKSDTVYKYQIDYNRESEEYTELLYLQGYEKVLKDDSFIIYRNKNLHAPDIHTDPEVFKQLRLSVLNRESLPGYIFIGIICVLIFCYQISLCLNEPSHLIAENIFFGLITPFTGIAKMFDTIFMYIARKQIEKDKSTKTLIKIRNAIGTVFIVIMMILFYACLAEIVFNIYHSNF